MRHATVLLAIMIALVPALPAQGRSTDPLCRKIRQAVQAGRTVDQILAELNTNVEQMMKCLQQRGRVRAKPKAAGKKPPRQNASPPRAKTQKHEASTAAQPAAARPKSPSRALSEPPTR